MPLDFSRCRVRPYAHQEDGIEKIITHPAFALFDEMGAGKSLQAIVAAQFLFERGAIDRVLVIAPASVRSVWFDPEYGELAKHLFTYSCITSWHAKIRVWHYDPVTVPNELTREDATRMAARVLAISTGELAPLNWLVTNYEYIRSKERLPEMLRLCSEKTLLILDESSAVKGANTQQTKACLKIRKKCGRVLLLNGTPIANHIGDMFAQGNLLDTAILQCPSYTQFKARYAIMGGYQVGGRFVQIVGWRDTEDIQRRFAPYVIRRLKKDCIGLPEKLPTVVMTKELTPTTWKIYTEMRDEMLVWLDKETVSQAPQIITKVMRLAQITSGFLGGVEDMDIELMEESPSLFVQDLDPRSPRIHEKSVSEIGREKLDFFLSWLQDRLEEDETLKVLVWSRFRPEILRLVAELAATARGTALAVGAILGGQKRDEREYALRLLDPRTAPDGPVVVVGSENAGSMGLSLTASHTVFGMSTGYSLKTRLQRDDRTHRPGQVSNVWYGDLLAVGPKGQKTINHVTFAALQRKENLATLTTSAWRKILTVA